MGNGEGRRGITCSPKQNSFDSSFGRTSVYPKDESNQKRLFSTCLQHPPTITVRVLARPTHPREAPPSHYARSSAESTKVSNPAPVGNQATRLPQPTTCLGFLVDHPPPPPSSSSVGTSFTCIETSSGATARGRGPTDGTLSAQCLTGRLTNDISGSAISPWWP